MRLEINGKSRIFDAPLTLAQLLEKLGMKPDRVAVELNRAIVSREKWASTHLREDDRLEIVHFVGGGALDLPPCGNIKGYPKLQFVLDS